MTDTTLPFQCELTSAQGTNFAAALDDPFPVSLDDLREGAGFAGLAAAFAFGVLQGCGGGGPSSLNFPFPSLAAETI